MNNFKNTILLSITIVVFLLTGCKKESKVKLKPNILWIYLEDTSPLLSSYGKAIIPTPNIDKLAKKGVVYKNVYMPAPVCSAARSSIITGVISTTLGTHNHHSSRTEESAIYLPDSIQTIPEIFRQSGYFTFNNGKDDYNFMYDRKELYSQDYLWHPMYGKKGEPLLFSEIKKNTPFFGQIQLQGGKEIFSSSFKENVKNPVDRAKVELPPYLPNHPAIIEEYANHLDAIQITDEKVGDIMRQLSENNLLANTVVFFFSDHGMRMTRHKQFLYDGGLHVPMIIADFSNGNKIGSGINSDLVSGLDLGTSSLALADIAIPDYMEGKNIFDDSEEREYVISTRDRCDFTIDRIRSVRSKKFKYIKNFMTDRPYTQSTYMDFDGIEFVKVMKQLHAENKLDSIQDRFFLNERPSEELYDIRKDPFELDNLAENLDYVDVKNEYAKVLNQWIVDTDDKGQYPENKEGLKLMLGIWGKHAVNREYEPLREEFKDLEGSLWEFKNQKAKKVTN